LQAISIQDSRFVGRYIMKKKFKKQGNIPTDSIAWSDGISHPVT